MNRFGIILTHNRPALLDECIKAIAPQVDIVIVVDNASDPPVDWYNLPEEVSGIYVEEQPPNLSRLWNIGIESATVMALDDGEEFFIALLCDDAIVPAGWFEAVTTAMKQNDAVAGCSSPYNDPVGFVLKKTAPDSDIVYRMPGWAFVLDGNKNLRADERLHWWWCDTDLDWRARAAGGMVVVGGYPVPNRLPNDFTLNVPGLLDQAGQDGLVFAEIHGSRPW
jgi:glycosyltransferase involved in cell wall biosynthesis